MNPENTAATPVQKKEDIRIVVNGGSETLESATVPYSWFFSDELVEKQPTHLLVIDQDEWIAKHSSNSEYQGERRVVRVDRASDFIQFHAPGPHRIAFIALKKPTDWSEKYFSAQLKRIVREEKRGQYGIPLYWNDIVSLQDIGRITGSKLAYCAIDATILEVDIPKEFFATEPGGKVGKFFYWVANFGLKTKPVDECQYRKRLIFAAPKLLGYALWLAFVNAICFPVACIVVSLWLIGARIAVLLVGFRPEPIFLGFRDLWNWKSTFVDVDGQIRRYGWNSYAVWTPDYESKTGKAIYMPITGLQVLICLGLVGLLYGIGASVITLFGHSSWKVLIAAVSMLVSSLLLTVVLMLNSDKQWHLDEMFGDWIEKRIAKSKSAKTTRKAEVAAKVVSTPPERDLLFFEWLQNRHSISQAPKRVAFEKLPEAFRGRHIQKFRAAFWWTKSKVCRPYRH